MSLWLHTRNQSLASILNMQMMRALVAVVLVLSSLMRGTTDMAMASDKGDFFKKCPPSNCSVHGPEIRFPFRLATNPPSCGMPGMELACSGHDTVLAACPATGSCKVTTIDYRHAVMKIKPPAGSWSQSRLQEISTSSSMSRYYVYVEDTSLIGCSREYTPNCAAASLPIGNFSPVSCLSNAYSFLYLVNSLNPVVALPLSCKVVSKDVLVPTDYMDNHLEKTSDCYEHGTETSIGFAEVSLDWTQLMPSDNHCEDCEAQGRHCGFNSKTNKTFCQHRGSHVKLIAVASSVATLVLSLIVVSTLYLSLKKKYDEEIHQKVEMFLKTYGTSKPTRYTFSEVKKIARRFKDKLGQGGFGSVYKGELTNGIPVAVKILESSQGGGEEFINEVATIGRIHHSNVVHLLGYCSEGTRRALIYEFMPNKSLEKYIFQQDPNIRQELVPEKMLDIALGIARGIEYLHQGCNQRILHFDIKPHNILLDYNFNPKISDFGLAKLCARDQSIVTLTAARGTMGYIAPELYSRNFGPISYKSDVYSFGMLMVEMVTRKRNSDPSIENENDIYLPEWLYEKLITEQELGLGGEMTQGEEQKVKKLAIVALWCIQWSPSKRPSMTKVLNMLTGSLQNLQMPPRPFVSSLSHQML